MSERSLSPRWIFQVGWGAGKLFTVHGGSTCPSSMSSGMGSLGFEVEAVMTLTAVAPPVLCVSLVASAELGGFEMGVGTAAETVAETVGGG